ncbi:MAG: hypothetical protein N2376_09570 [Clostridia bacterium]|nr:hypothetical protein [Clostridia bacterium]
MELCENHIKILRSNGYKMLTISEEEDSRRRVLTEFLTALADNRPGETDIYDNFKTFSIVHAMIESVIRHEPFVIKY